MHETGLNKRVAVNEKQCFNWLSDPVIYVRQMQTILKQVQQPKINLKANNLHSLLILMRKANLPELRPWFVLIRHWGDLFVMTYTPWITKVSSPIKNFQKIKGEQ